MAVGWEKERKKERTQVKDKKVRQKERKKENSKKERQKDKVRKNEERTRKQILKTDTGQKIRKNEKVRQNKERKKKRMNDWLKERERQKASGPTDAYGFEDAERRSMLSCHPIMKQRHKIAQWTAEKPSHEVVWDGIQIKITRFYPPPQRQKNK